MPDVWRYTWQSTFITIEPEVCSKSNKRTQSSPPAFDRDSVPVGIFEAHKNYVSALEHRVSQAFPRQSKTAQVEKVEEVAPAQPQPAEAEACSVGSKGHPELCGRPCSFALTQSCSKGQSCGYCHMNHDSRPSHLDRRQREILRRLNATCRLQLLLSVMRIRAEKQGFSADAAQLFSHLEDHLAKHTTPEERAQPLKPQLTGLMSALKRITFTELVGLAVSGARAPLDSSASGSDDLELLVRSSMTALRNRFSGGHRSEAAALQPVEA